MTLLLRCISIEANDSRILDLIRYSDGIATDLAVFDITLSTGRKVKQHRNLFPAVRTLKEMFF